MTDDTLSPVAAIAALTDVFDRHIVKTRLQPQERYALSFIHESFAGSLQATVREVLIAGIDALGWPVDRRVEEYARYKVECIRTGTDNEFESR